MRQRLIAVFLVCTVLGLIPFASARSDGPPVYLVTLSGAVTPATADFMADAIDQAGEAGAGCLVILLDTPGGLVESTRQMVMAIYDSRVPVVVYVAPSGARAASAGVMITMAADVAAMAPGTHIGAAHPVNAGGKDIGETMAEKVTNDTVAFIKSIAERRGRNVKWAEEAVRESVSVTESEALDKKIIDLVARDLDDLLAQINGRELSGRTPIAVDPDQRVWIAESLRVRILKALSDPNIAYILMMIGLAGLYFELSHPGVVLPGVIGSIALVLAFYAFQTLPVNVAGVLLIVLALIFFILEMKIASYGLLSVAGIVSLLIGSVMLFDRTDGQMGVSWQVIIPTLALVGGFFVAVAALVFRAHTRQPMTGGLGLIGKIAVVKTPLSPTGRVQIHGELWFARCPDPVAAGARVRVIAMDGLTLEVEPINEESH
ncbi:NfeD family protein [Desulfosarcina ovata]|uniref:Serine protease n=1 Tax=Desulfosarcina ovata subsp. ovata TaxID=2752305 RepID=A0A5K8AA03_9BACT|nr:nodulation protein NfeD [Desulfosarcina ovata]BBO89004.1 serine protease [Desulfosarcina ovata subsp. ovata]